MVVRSTGLHALSRLLASEKDKTAGNVMDIQPDKQNLDRTFATTVYYIDFYQRDYKWTDEPVRLLIDDVFYQFDEAYAKQSHLEPKTANVNARYPA